MEVGVITRFPGDLGLLDVCPVRVTSVFVFYGDERHDIVTNVGLLCQKLLPHSKDAS
jgi:hypothetical protein